MRVVDKDGAIDMGDGDIICGGGVKCEDEFNADNEIMSSAICLPNC
nr:hypothetical protein [Moraxella catarrhalis]